MDKDAQRSRYSVRVVHPLTCAEIIFVHKDIQEKFMKRFIEKVDSMRLGLPWQKDVKITPLPEEGKPGLYFFLRCLIQLGYLQELIKDALSHGAKIVNAKGGKLDRTFVAPTVVFPGSILQFLKLTCQ
jgi:glyceraldehyde-3-phosphate dehydrogenase (NADP+)